MHKILTALLLLAVSLQFAQAEDEVTSTSAPPDWYKEDVQFMSRDGGKWLTDNSEYKSDEEPFEAYVTEWVAGPANASLSGKLYGLKDGEPSEAFWHFSEYWDPATEKVVLQQYGWGGIGKGTSEPSADEAGVTLIFQTFDNFDGSSFRTGHKSTKPDADTHVTTSFEIDGEGNWKKRRHYVWKHQPTD